MDATLIRAEDKPQLLAPLFTAYSEMLYNVDEGMRQCLANQDYDEELSHLVEKYSPPSGSIYVVMADGEVAGMGALLRLEPDCGELKRIFIYPQFRGRGIGDILMDRLLSDAVSYGYHHIKLDTFPAMIPAIGLYRKLGFYEIPKYNTNPLERAIFFQKDL